VGEDQLQHLELTRDIIESFNRQYGALFPLPEISIGMSLYTPSLNKKGSEAVPSKRILSLRDPSTKMSKSAPNAASRVTITDSSSTILSNIRSAVTDSTPGITFDPINRPGVSNLLLIWSALDENGRSPAQLAEEVEGWGMGKLKSTIGEVVVERLRPVRENYERIIQDRAWLSEVAARGREKAGANAAKTMEEVRRAMGLNHI
jgi:tryptophanyl-tRNA synthetase